MLVLLYFFFNQLVYVIMFMFCTASTMAMYMCLEPLVMMTYKLPCFPVVTLPRMNLYLCILQLELRWHIKIYISGSSLIHVLPRQLVLLLSSIATTVSWFVFRKEDWSWILQVLRFLQFQLDTIELFLQDFLGIMFSINMLKVLRLPSLRICTILLSALFFYDIFFVFITPLFMSGKSVMVEVATGHSSDEQLPMVKQS